MRLVDMDKDVPDIVKDGHKFWLIDKYKGFQIVAYKSPDGNVRKFLVGDKKGWLFDNHQLESCLYWIDGQDLIKQHTKRKKNVRKN